jgi:sarcosine oxidase subunit gamma
MDSPLSTWAPSRRYLWETAFLSQVDLRTDTPAEFAPVLGVSPPTEPNTVAVCGDVAVLWLGPDEWLVVGPAGEPTARRLSTVDAFASVVDVSAHRTAIDVTGPHAWDVLSQGCALDGVALGRCAQTMVAHAAVIVWRLDDGYRLLVRSSFARYLADWLDDAAIEY